MKRTINPFATLLSLMESTVTSDSTSLVVVNGHTFDELRLENNEESMNSFSETLFIDGQPVAELTYGGFGFDSIVPVGSNQNISPIDVINYLVDALQNGEVVTRGR